MAPAAGTLGDRFSRKRVLLVAYVLQTVAMAAAAIALAIGAPAPIVYAFATLTATAITMTRPVQSALLPDVATTPDQLTAANVASGTIEGAGTLLGPGARGGAHRRRWTGPRVRGLVGRPVPRNALGPAPRPPRHPRRARRRSRSRRTARPHALARVHRDCPRCAASRHRGGLRRRVPADGRPRHLLRRARPRRLRTGRRRRRVRRVGDRAGPARSAGPWRSHSWVGLASGCRSSPRRPSSVAPWPSSASVPSSDWRSSCSASRASAGSSCISASRR